MIELPEPKHVIPEQLKADNWAFHYLARSDDPAVKCLNVGNLVDNLIATIDKADVADYTIIIDGKTKTLSEYLKYQTVGANKAWNLYSQGKTGEAVEIAKAVLRAVLFLVYDDRYTTSIKNSFTGRVTK
jgi:hypothetical protein